MKIGVSTLLTERSVDVAILAIRAEELGFESVWVPEQHTLPVLTSKTVPRLWGDIVDPLIALSRASAVTSKIGLGTAVIVVTDRHPITLAKEVATLDAYSGGRVLLGIGTGSLKEQAEILGSDFPHRWTQAREAVLAMKELWTKGKSEFRGAYYNFPAVYCYPKPVQKPHPPLLLGSKAPNVLKRVVAYADGWIPIGLSPEEIRIGRAELDRLAEAAERPVSSIEITVMELPANRSEIARYEEAGADRVLVGLPTAGEEESLTKLEQIAESVLR